MKYCVVIFERFTKTIVISFTSTDRDLIFSLADVLWKHISDTWRHIVCVYVVSYKDVGDSGTILLRIPELSF